MNIALTGANGSIGKELIPFLRGLGHNVYRISSSIPSDGEFYFSYKELIARSINVKIDVFFHLASINSNLAEEEINDEVNLTRDMLLSLPSLDCKKLTKAVLKDASNGAYQCDPDKPCSKGFYKIMLVKAPDPMYQDFHFYRQDKDGTWSHKQGWGYGPTKLDADGKVIIDPRYSNRNFKPFNYSVVCSSMCVPKQYKYNI